MRLRSSILPALVLALATAAPAHAAFFGSTPIDGPNPDILRVGDQDVARDGTGAVAYFRRDGGVEHLFLSRLTDGTFGPPERIDGAFGGSTTRVAVAASDGGRLVVAFINSGDLIAVVRPAGGPGFTPPQPIAPGATEVSADMSIGGVGWISYTAPGTSPADVRVARLDRSATQFAGLPDPLDIDTLRNAGVGTGRSDIAVSADGTAVVTWGEGDHVYARRVFENKLSAAPQDLNVDTLGDYGGGPADLPDVDIEDDSSFAWVAFRQGFTDGRTHAITRRLVGSQFEAPTAVDGLGVPGADDVRGVSLDLSGRGEGLTATGSATFGAFGSIVHEDVFNTAQLLNAGNAVDPLARAGVAENNDAYAAFLQGTSTADAGAYLVPYNIDPAKHTAPPPGAEQPISNGELGPVDPAGGLDLAVDRAGDATAMYVQGYGDGRRLMVGGFDREPGIFRTYTSSKYRKFARPRLSWSESFDLWAPIRYRIEIDGQPVGETFDTRATTLNRVPDGPHTWRVVAVDKRGQQTATPVRTLRVDSGAPAIAFTVSGSRRKGKPVRVSAQVADGSLQRPIGSGVRTVRIDFGDGTRVNGRKATHRYRRGGSFTVRVVASDKAGNVRSVRQRIRIKK